VPDRLVLLPGMNCSARLWMQVVQRLETRLDGLKVGYGELDGHSIDACVSDLLDRLPDRFALAGLSLGGIVAMALVRRAPERVTRLCLMSTNPYGPTSRQRSAWASQRHALAFGRTARDIQRDLLPVLLYGPNRTPELDEQVLKMADETGEQALDRQLRAQATRIDERPWLPEVRVPTLIAAAAEDALCPVSRHEEMHALIPLSRLVILDHVGHLSPLEAPARMVDALTDWLA
jgi:pimeloyl-ACP methyl ester carboxylesterase